MKYSRVESEAADDLKEITNCYQSKSDRQKKNETSQRTPTRIGDVPQLLEHVSGTRPRECCKIFSSRGKATNPCQAGKSHNRRTCPGQKRAISLEGTDLKEIADDPNESCKHEIYNQHPADKGLNGTNLILISHFGFRKQGEA